MNRLQKKCFVASAALHSLLFVILLVGPAFLSRKNVANDMPVLDVIPSKLVDELMSGGGNPTAQPPPPAPPPEAVKPQPQPEKFVKPEPQPIEPPKMAKPETIPDEKPTRKPLPQVSTKLIDRSNLDPKAKEQAKAEAQAKARAEAARRAAEFKTALRSLKDGLSSSTTVEMPGPGGEAYANYAQVVKSVYEQAWIAPDDVTDESATTKVSVTIDRSGTVISARIIRDSANGSVDKSVQATLHRVKFVAPFPAGAKEQQRTFMINFNLKAKRLLG
ncbi:MAG: TonB family protein [Verrucomicrobia bacterium]|nr:TonB family protein [Verrucomicrobiota bacterium]